MPQQSTALGPGAWLVRREGGRYYIRFRDKQREPDQKWIPLETTRQDAASRKAGSLYREYLLGIFDPWYESAHEISVDDALRRYLTARAGAVSAVHLSDMQREVARFMRSPAVMNEGVTMLHQVTSDQIRAYIQSPSLAPATRAGYHRRLRAFFAWCERAGLVTKSPVHSVEKPRAGRLMPKHWTEAQLDQFLIAADDLDERSREHIHTRDANPRWCQHAAELLFVTGLRISEAVRLSWGDIRFPDDAPGRIYVTQGKGQTKSRQDRVVPMLGRCEALLRLMERETRQTSRDDEPVLKTRDGVSPISANHTNRRFNRYRKHAGLPAIGLHGLRHSFAFHLLQRGVGIDHVKEFLGHGSLAVTEVYAKMSPEERLRIVQEAMSR